MNTRAAWIAIILSTATGIAEAGKPDWCSQNGITKESDHERALSTTDPLDAFPALAGASCKNDENVTEAQITAARAKWNARLDLTDADWATDVVPWVLEGPSTRSIPMFGYDTKKGPSAFDAIEQYARIKKTAWTGSNDPLYAIDQLGTNLTMAGRLAAIENCLRSSKPAEWALCQPDIDAFDRKKIGAEMHADKSSRGFERMAIRIAAEQVSSKLKDHAAKIKDLIAKDPAYGTLFTISATAHKEWAASPPDASLLAVVAAMDDASMTQSSKAFAGCEESTWDAFTKAVGAMPAAKFKDLKSQEYMLQVVRVLTTDRDAYLASVAVHRCHDKNANVLDKMIGDNVRRWPGFRGPRSTALSRMITNPITLDDRNATVELPQINRLFEGQSTSGGGGEGVVASVKPAGDQVTVAFVRKPTKVQVCSAWKDTGHISQITSTGAIIYGYTCTKYTTETLNYASEPQTVKKKYAAGVKSGVHVMITEDVVVSVAPKPGAAPTHVFGVAVK